MGKRRTKKTQSGASRTTRPRSAYGVGNNGVRNSFLVSPVIAALAIGTIWYATADPIHDRGLLMNGTETVGTPTGDFQSTTQRGRWSPTVTYFVEYSYTVDGAQYTGAGSTGYKWDDRPASIDTTQTAVVYFDPDDRRDSYIPDDEQN
jgi:hypothetical protein